MVEEFDCIVVGLGHAGSEAALASARLGCHTLGLALNLDSIGLLPCNPSIGGPGKGQLVREIDALGGQMALVADRARLQGKTLNTGKGIASRALRVQVDKRLYQVVMRRTMEREPNLTIRQAQVTDLLLEGGRVAGVRARGGLTFRAAAVVLATGVYLDSRIIIGEEAWPGGPNGQASPGGLAEALVRMGLPTGRFKTGTPPRVDGRRFTWRRLETQAGDSVARPFSYRGGEVPTRQLPTYATRTTPQTHRIIRENLHRSPMYSGVIQGRGPRYCPSIEDKVVRFADVSSHPVYLEPEGWDTTEYYVAGVSTSLPEDVQAKILGTIPGLENARILRPGYAIEYTFLDPTQLTVHLAHREIAGFFCAGQVNGTSGYEEAAAQGLVAGINAARFLRGEEALRLSRGDAYIGVLLDDLVCKGVTEPYRMLSARAEYRLGLRQDNADLRLMETGHRVGLVEYGDYAACRERGERVERLLGELRRIRVAVGGGNLTAEGLLRRPGVTLEELMHQPELHDWADMPLADREEVEVRVKYAGYLGKEAQQVERLRRFEAKKMPLAFAYDRLPSLSKEAREKLNAFRPGSLGEAMRLPGVSPADALVLLAALGRRERP